MQQHLREHFLSEMPNTILTTVEYLETGADEQSGDHYEEYKRGRWLLCV